MQLSTLFLSTTLLISSVLCAPAAFANYGSSSDAEVMLKRQLSATNYDSLMLGRDVALEKRLVYNPKITCPVSSTVWTAGQSYTVEWDSSDIPVEAEAYKGMIKLGYTPADGAGGLNLHWTLADGFPIKDGKVKVTLPEELKERNDYIIVVMGDSGNASEMFTIKPAGSGEKSPLGEEIKKQVEAKINAAFDQAGI
ncbi:uncharacterized protein UTRI_04743_B [Ustilago trichophora]|uniref:Uncharacterized protein n=1 Tax=Ustilago trichophora TaxID=86804 RepID=A0A5C3EFW7_9BASI|nr:uncharacterized protein UTRI_04743_B [Ustilago trichophora]